MLKKSHYELADFLQTLSNGKEVFDFEKIEGAGFPIVLVITERGSKGKTLNIKEHFRKSFIKTGRPNAFMNTTVKLVEKTKADFLKDLREKPFVRKSLGKKAMEFWDNVQMKGDVEKVLCWAKHEGKDFIKLLPLAHAEYMKGARLHWKHIVLDELNVGWNQVPEAMTKLMSFLHSAEDLVADHNSYNDKKLWIFGNNKSLNNPLIYKMGVTHIENDITEVYDENGNKLLLIICPQFDDDDKRVIEEDNKNNWIYSLSKQVGEANHSYFNESLYDEVNNVKRYTHLENVNEYLLPYYSVHHNKQYYNIYKVKQGVNKGMYHIISVTPDEKIGKTFAFLKRDIKEFVTYQRQYKNTLQKLLSSNYISFEDVVSRDLFISSITK